MAGFPHCQLWGLTGFFLERSPALGEEVDLAECGDIGNVADLFTWTLQPSLSMVHVTYFVHKVKLFLQSSANVSWGSSEREGVNIPLDIKQLTKAIGERLGDSQQSQHCPRKNNITKILSPPPPVRLNLNEKLGFACVCLCVCARPCARVYVYVYVYIQEQE